MALPIEDYAIIGDCKSAAWSAPTARSTGYAGPVSIHRLASPRCLARREWRCLISPTLASLGVKRRYRPGTLVLETEFQTETGRAAILDFMPPADGANLVRIVIGRSGRVDFRTEYVARFDYGATVLGSGVFMTGRSALSPALSAWLAMSGRPIVARISRRLETSRSRTVNPSPSSFRTAPRFSLHRARSILSNRWSARRPFGEIGATGVPRSAPGPKPSNARWHHGSGGRADLARRAGSSLRRRHLLPSSSAASRTGITAIAGCGTPRSRSWP